MRRSFLRRALLHMDDVIHVCVGRVLALRRHPILARPLHQPVDVLAARHWSAHLLLASRTYKTLLACFERAHDDGQQH